MASRINQARIRSLARPSHARDSAADLIARSRRADATPNSDRIHGDLDGHRAPDRVPKAEPILGAARVERHVWPVRNPVENPMAHDADPNRNGARPVAREGVVHACEERGPNAAHQQTVRPRIVVEIEWRVARVARGRRGHARSQAAEKWARECR